MKTSDFYYDLPKELIAQDPLEDRSSSRLLVLGKEDGSIEHRYFRDILTYLKPGDCLVLNNTRVIPARLYGKKEDTGALIEVLLLTRREDNVWETLVKPGKKARIGARISFGEGLLTGEVVDVLEEGNRLIRFTYQGIFEEILEASDELKKNKLTMEKIVCQDSRIYLFVGQVCISLGNHVTPEKMAQIPPILEKLEGKEGTLHLESYSGSQETITFDVGEFPEGISEENSEEK